MTDNKNELPVEELENISGGRESRESLPGVNYKAGEWFTKNQGYQYKIKNMASYNSKNYGEILYNVEVWNGAFVASTFAWMKQMKQADIDLYTHR